MFGAASYTSCGYPGRFGMCSLSFVTGTRKRLLTLLWLILYLMVFTASLCWAQVDSSRIVGTVVDSSGAVVIGAAVKVVNTETNITVSATTNEFGEYTATSLKPGVYSISAEKSGFKTAVQSAIKLDINQVARVDFSLQPGEVTERVEVTAAEPLDRVADVFDRAGD